MLNHPNLGTPDHILLAISIISYFNKRKLGYTISPHTLDHMGPMLDEWDRAFPRRSEHEFCRAMFDLAIQIVQSYNPQTLD